MKLEDAVKVLEEYQAWRKGAYTEMLHPKVISEAIEVAINLLQQLNKTNQNEIRKGN
jgi:hypothetical protein